MRTPALSQVIRLLRLAHLANENPENVNSVFEARETSAFGAGFIDRREMLKRSLKVGGLTAGAHLLGGCSFPFSRNLAGSRSPASPSTGVRNERADPVLIVGGGIAGLTAAYQLQKNGVPCALYEASERWGGRMFTLANFNSDGMFCELGGEAVDSDHTALMTLCAELGVGIQDLTADDRGLDNELYFAEGRVISTRQFMAALQPLAREVAKDFQELWGGAPARMPTYKDKDNPAVLKYDRMSLANYFHGKKNVDQWALDLIGTLYVCEYGLDLEEQSALNFLTLATVGGAALKPLGMSDEKFRIEGGSSALCSALIQFLTGKVPFYLGHQLLKIEDKSGGLRFTFNTGSSGNSGASSLEVSARQAICTIPFSTLRFVEGVGALELNPALKKAISELGYGNVSKWMTGYKSRFWRKAKNHPCNGTLLSVERQQFWEASRRQKGESGILTRFLAGSKATQLSYESLEKDIQFLDHLYPGAKKEFEDKQVLMPWGSFPWSKGCYSGLRPGQYTSLNGLAAETHLGGRLLFAGEHTSVDYGGFMNGAIESGKASAGKIIRLAR